ncbi:MAG TPA: glycosyltransferase family 2 protein [Steroidobacteraceae bacterium]|nr:glycosyltransferase family 2 protein [Steroidobacteraceae bacterium]
MQPEVSVVIPVCNEAENIEPLAREIDAALRGRVPFEIIYVDDGSTDATADIARRLRERELPNLRLLRHSFRSGQSAAVRSGVAAARAPWVATLDGDGQNDPADLPKFLDARREPANADVLLIMGNRVTRRDTWLRRLSSRIANGVRSSLLGDGTPDTGCGIKIFHRDTFLSLPAFDHMHRFLPALFMRAGSQVVSIPVNHRPRTRGKSKYGLHNRLWVGIVDLFGVMWLRARYRAGLKVTEG